ncbi:hydantoinase/oxoprolinase family protein [Ketogulonicigenium vulgare]|uniref:5-oxoprolinase (ATP-hydrolyzing) n=1 Tax=Ketogulonicigenium vulgare (strain WSH-001) TaxID=759362 RepID=F9YB46_KETVW|nr:hydantoinase/oxoprolinase family protein [Ketogulonicigenium vulgare]ADO44074.1 hydantoinase/oxoprolinase [Ketogulonicigenium vulgare Y25]AEM42598.1 5-oxoprolinase (ATP-hydrolyzing) [Ketogulonicigenium vulgare WSH-001]ALJ82625.1 5-oxoprolinase [Ketogulonicigenium vulgare]ANW35379.1 5-oxoprolinase [Ketogulonicigenium vulgare]AOZ53299.1 hydantoinase/oxoprolinase [Ketogulonicigenium vulgare]
MDDLTFHAPTGGCRIGIDVGGTFTDFVLADAETGAVTIFKEPSVPSDPSASVELGLPKLLARAGKRPQDVQLIVHGTTIGLNAIIQRRGAKLGLVVSRGHRGVLEIGRSNMPSAFSYLVPKEEALVKRRLIAEVSQRILPDGSVEGEATEDALDAIAAHFIASGVDAVGVLLVHSHRRADVEIALADRLAARMPQVAVTASAAVWPEQREYERGLVALINAYVQPIMTSYLNRLQTRVAGLGIAAPIYITANNGGTLSLATAAARPIDTLLSGPASGVVAAAAAARASGVRDVITVDMGGTSADMSVVSDGQPETGNRTHIGDFPIIVPVVNVSAIGAGGGSIVWVDPHGVLKIGPASAGADPGPVSYGRGGTAPTVTDCFLVSGFIDPDRFVGGRMRLDIAAARAALDGIGAKIGLPAGETRAARAAEAALRVTTAVMTAEMAKNIAQRGQDLRSFTLLPFGGAGPTQANLIAESAGLSQILVPARPGTFCALGAIMADVKRDYVRSSSYNLMQGDAAPALAAAIADMTAEAAAWVAGEGDILTGHAIAVTFDMRYHKQAFDLSVPLVGAPDAAALVEGFHLAHERLYHFRDPDADVEITAIRLRVTGHVVPLRQEGNGQALTTASGTVPGAVSGTGATQSRQLFWNGAAHPAAVHTRDSLGIGSRLIGPAIVEQEDTTVVILPGWTGEVDDAAHLIVTRNA